MKSNYLDTKKIEYQITNLPTIAFEKGWKLTYDKELDQLFLTARRVPTSTQLFTVGGEYSIYIGKNSQVHGVLIEYFKTNFLKHNHLRPAKARNTYSWSLKRQLNLLKKFQTEIVKSYNSDLQKNPKKFSFANI